MKTRIFRLFCVAAAFAAASCRQELPEPIAADGTCPQGYHVEELTALYPVSETRTAFDVRTGGFSWSEGDTIAFHLSDGTYTKAAVDASTGKVRLYIRDGVYRDQFAVYPASIVVEEHATIDDMKITLPDRYDISADVTSMVVPMPMLAVQDAASNTLEFKHAGALLQFNLTLPAGTKTARVSLGGKALSGTMDVVSDGEDYKLLATDAAEIGDGGAEITFTVSEDGLAEETEARLNLPVSTGSYEKVGIVYNNGIYDSYSFEKPVSLSFARAAGKKLSVAHTAFTDEFDCLWFEALIPGSSVSMTCVNGRGTNINSSVDLELYYSTDNKVTWQAWDFSSVLLENVGDRMYVYNAAEKMNRYSSTLAERVNARFQGTGSLAVGGDIMYLLDSGKGEMYDYCFWRLFYGNACLADASELVLPDTVTDGCYYGMFMNCSKLAEPPVLPSTETAAYCYFGLFSGTKVTKMPALPALEVKNDAYESMFSGCTALTEVSDLPATVVGDNGYTNMFYGCTSLVEAPAISATSVGRRSMYRMFGGCTRLESAPLLPAKELASSCYDNMFNGCTSLVSVPALPATTLAESSYSQMFSGCTSLETVEIEATDVDYPTSLFQMFYNCKSLNSITVHFTEWPTENPRALYGWDYNVAEGGTFHKPSALEELVDGSRSSSACYHIPYGWTIVSDEE